MRHPVRVARLTPLSSAILGVNQVIRFHYFGFTSSVTLLGALSVAVPGAREIAVLLGVSLAFHVFAYMQNDVIDLEVDRTQALRQGDMLVKGRMKPRLALAIALSQIPLSLSLLAWVGAPAASWVAAGTGFLLMSIYNVYGKRCPFPPATDLVQGLGWGTLALVGALACGGRISWLSVLAGAHAAGFLLLINGVHGGLRDLRNDRRCGMKTTAIRFGARPLADGTVLVSRGLQRFAWFAFAVLVAPWAVAFAVNLFGYDARSWWMALGPWLALQVASIAVLRRVVAPIEPKRESLISAHGLPLLLSPIVAFLPLMSARFAAITLLSFFGPFLVTDPGLKRARGLLRRCMGAPRDLDVGASGAGEGNMEPPASG